jgi:Flp pilus assembly protein TadD
MSPARWIILSLLGLTLFCYGHVCLADFIDYDDPYYVTNNPHVLGGLSRTDVEWAFTDAARQAGYYIPLTWLSLQADAALYGPQAAWGFHLTNLLLHSANVVLIFWVLERMTGRTGLSAMTAALFAVHPLHVESVAWVTERKDVLSMLFLLLTLAAYHRYTLAPSVGRYLLMFALFAAGLMSKPILVTLPFGLLLLDYWPLYRLRLGQAVLGVESPQPAVRWYLLVAEKVPLLVCVVVFSILTYHFESDLGAVGAAIPLDQRIRVMLSGYLSYLEKTFWPTNLAVNYPWQLPGVGRVTLAAAVLLAATAALLTQARGRPALIVGWFWFLGTLFPVSGIVQVGPFAFADRHAYVPHLGLFVLVVWGISESVLWQHMALPTRKALAGLTLVALAALCWIQVWYWQNSETLFLHALSVTEKNFDMHYTLSAYYSARGNYEEAEQHLARAVAIRPDDPRGRFFYGIALLDGGKPEPAAEELQQAARLDPNNADVQCYLGSALEKLGRLEDARAALQKSTELWTSHPRRDFQLGDLKARYAKPYLLLGEVRLREGKPDLAIEPLERALQIKPELAGPHYLLGVALGRLKRWPEAEAMFRQAITLSRGNDTLSRGYLAHACARQNKKDEAAREYADLLARVPDWPGQASRFALELLTREQSLDRIRAAELATQVCEATDYKDVAGLDALAAAQAARGDFASARTTIRQAQKLTSDPLVEAQLRERLSYYNQDRPLPVRAGGP